MEVLKVSSRSKPTLVAGALAGAIKESGSVEIQVVGAGALNQAVKAVAVARGFLSSHGMDLVCVPTFTDIKIDGESRTAVRLLVESRQIAPAPSMEMDTALVVVPASANQTVIDVRSPVPAATETD